MTLLPFYLKQGLINSKKNAIIILILALSLALIPALGMLTNGFISTMVFQMAGTGGVDDGKIQIIDPDFRNNLEFEEQKTFIEGMLIDNGVEFEDLASRLDVSLERSFFYSNSTLPTNDILTDDTYKNTSSNFAQIWPKFDFRDADYFNSTDFGQNYGIIEGSYPTTPYEFLINWKIAQKFNLSSGTPFNLTLRVKRGIGAYEFDEIFLENNDYTGNIYYTDVNIEDFTICGLYLEKAVYDSDREYTYKDYLENETYDTFNLNKREYRFYNSIFSFYNFSLSKSQMNHPVFQLFDNIGNLPNVNNESSPNYYDVERSLEFESYLFFQTNLDNFNLISLQKESRIAMEQYDNLNSDLGSEYRLYWSMPSFLQEITIITFIARIGIAIINLPILIFVLSLGILSARVIRKSRISDFLRLRIKGLTKKMVLRQSTIEALINGLLACILSFIIGIGLFFALRGEILRILEILTETEMPFGPSDVTPIIMWVDILNTMFWGISCCLIMYIPIFYYNRKLSLADLIAVKEAKDLPVIYDEVTVYDKEVDQLSINWREFLQLDNGEEIREEPNVEIIPDQEMDKKCRKGRKNGSMRSIFRKARNARKARKTTPIYEDFIKQYEKKIPKIAILLIIIGILPILVNLLFYNFLDNNSSDYLMDILYWIRVYGQMYYLPTIFLIISILSPILIISGLVRYIGVEKPSRLAKISKFLSTPILGPLNRLFGLKMISSKELIKWIKVFTIFASILIAVNMFTNSVYRYQVIADNLIIGADVKLEADVDPTSALFPEDLLEQTENLLNNLTNENNQSYVNSIVTCQKIIGKMTSGDEYFPNPDTDILSVNLSEYLEIIQEDHKILPNPTIIETIEELEIHQQQSLLDSSDLPGILLSNEIEQFLDPNDNILGFNISYFNYSSGMKFSKVIEFQIIGFLELPPGLVKTSRDSSSSIYFALLDQEALQEVDCTPIYNHIYQLLDINQNICPNSTTIIQNVSQSTEELLTYGSISIYNQDWILNNQEFLSLFSIVQIVETVLYFLAVVLAVTLGLLLNALKNSDDKFYSLLYTRGYGKKGVIKILLSQIFVMFVIGSVIGIICGYFIPSIYIKFIQEQFEYSFDRYNARVNFSLPIYWEPIKTLSILSGILAGAAGIFFIINFLKRQNLNKSLQQF